MSQEKAGAQTTDPTGRIFFSYSRKRLDEATMMLQALHELGIPTWQDLKDLGSQPTERELRRVIADPRTAGAILWVTPEVETSRAILEIEASSIFKRFQQDSSFLVVLVAAGGLSYDDAADLLRGYISPYDACGWNQCRAETDPLELPEARSLATKVLENRVSSLHAALPMGEPLKMRFFNRTSPGFEPGWALAVDWSHLFRGRMAPPEAWAEHLLPAIATIYRVLGLKAPGRSLEASGRCTLSAAFALGCQFSVLGEQRLSWRQTRVGDPVGQVWDPGAREAAEEERAHLEVRCTPSRFDGEDLVVQVSISDDTAPPFGKLLQQPDAPTFKAVLEVFTPGVKRPPGEGFQALHFHSAGEALSAAQQIIEAIRNARRTHQPRRIHLFLAAPAGLAVLLGQLANTLGPIQLYEHREAAGSYVPSVEVRGDEEEI